METKEMTTGFSYSDSSVQKFQEYPHKHSSS